MVSVEDRILAVANRREELLGIIASTEHVAPALAQNLRDSSLLSAKHFDVDNAYGEFLEVFKREQKEYEDIRDSKVRRLFGGSSYSEKLKKEEDDFNGASEIAKKLNAARKEAKERLNAADQARKDLRKLRDQRASAIAELDNLYDLVFDGNTAGHEEEDALEQKQQDLEEDLKRVQIPVSRAASAINFIAMARGSIDHAERPGAHWPGGWSYRWVLPCMMEAFKHLISAHELDPDVRRFEIYETEDEKRAAAKADQLVNIPAGNHLVQKDFLETWEGVRWAAAVVDEQMETEESKFARLSAQRDDVANRLKLAREELQHYRSSIFEQVLRNGGELAPAYEESMALDSEAAPAYSKT